MIRYFDRLKKFDYLVRHSMTGSPKDCAAKLGISRSRFYEFLEELEILEIPVGYDRSLKSYYYSRSGKLKIGFEDENKILNCIELRRINGGEFNSYSFMAESNMRDKLATNNWIK